MCFRKISQNLWFLFLWAIWDFTKCLNIFKPALTLFWSWYITLSGCKSFSRTRSSKWFLCCCCQGVVFSRDAIAPQKWQECVYFYPVHGSHVSWMGQKFWPQRNISSGGKMSKTQKLICHPQLGQMSGENVLKCSFSVNLAGVGGNRRAQLEIGSKHCAENAHSGLMYIFHLKRLSSSCVAGTYKHVLKAQLNTTCIYGLYT